MPGKPDGFVVDALHQAAVARNDPSPVIDQFIAENSVEMPFGNRHANRCRQTLPQRPGGGFNAGKFKIFRMARTGAV